MAYITWDDSFSVNISSIDEQHKKLFSLINEYYDGIKQNYSQELLIKLLDGLADYTVYHFTYEEELFKKYGYAESETHVLNHKEFVDKVSGVKLKISDKKTVAPVEITNYLKAWLTEHIKNTDKLYSSFLIEKGVS